MARRSDHSREEIREMALAAAQRLVTDGGLAGLTARKVAAEIGYTVGTLYLVFRNLDDLILHLNARTLDDLYGEMQAAVADCPAPLDCLHALGHTYIDFAARQGHRWELIYEHKPGDDFEVPAWYRDKVAQSLGLVEGCLRSLTPDRDPREIHEAARALWGGVHGICILSLTGKLDVTGVQSVQDLANSLIGNFIQGFTH